MSAKSTIATAVVGKLLRASAKWLFYAALVISLVTIFISGWGAALEMFAWFLLPIAVLGIPGIVIGLVQAKRAAKAMGGFAANVFGDMAAGLAEAMDEANQANKAAGRTRPAGDTIPD